MLGLKTKEVVSANDLINAEGVRHMDNESIVDEYILYLRPLARAELDWFASQPHLKMAISLAARAIGSNGKRLSHQNRIPQAAMQEAHDRLTGAVGHLRRLQTFADLHRYIDGLVGPIRNIGELYVYDVALRIGAALGLLPTEVYIHSGVRSGARKLGFKGARKTISLGELPSAFHRLSPHELEDVLCIYKKVLGNGRGGTVAKCGPRTLLHPAC